MNSFAKKSVVLGLAVLGLSQSLFTKASASETTAGNVSTSSASESPDVSAILDQLSVSYFANFHGSPIGEISSPYSLNNQGKKSGTSTVNFDSNVTAAYKITNTIGIGPEVPFLLFPVLGKGILLGDVGIKAYNKALITGNGFNLYTNLILQAPTSADSKHRGLDFGVKTTPAVRYQFPASRFTVGAWTEAKAYVGVAYGKNLKLYGAPYVNYQLSPNFSLNLEYEMETHHLVGKPTLDFTNHQTDLQPGFVWNVTREIMVNPYLQLFTGNRVTADTTAVGAIISATVL